MTKARCDKKVIVWKSNYMYVHYMLATHYFTFARLSNHRTSYLPDQRGEHKIISREKARVDIGKTPVEKSQHSTAISVTPLSCSSAAEGRHTGYEALPVPLSKSLSLQDPSGSVSVQCAPIESRGNPRTCGDGQQTAINGRLSYGRDQ